MQLTCLKGYCTSFDILDVAGFFGQVTVQNAAAQEKEKKKGEIHTTRKTCLADKTNLSVLKDESQ